MELIFVGGIHGAGKTTLCRKLAETIDATHYSAGQLIQDWLTTESPSHKPVESVDGNQRALVAAVDEIRLSHGTVLLDGHFTLLTSRGGISEIPIKVFKTLQPVVLLLLDTQPREVVTRLRARDGIEYDESLFSEFRDREISHAKAVSRTLGVRLEVLPQKEAVTSALCTLRKELQLR